ncbi:MAG: Gfo/Idh/MocA family oxidoreductase [Deinococcales bacterium]
MRVGIIGCGNISGAYLKASKLFRVLDVVAVADLDKERAQAKAQEFNLKAYGVSELLADDSLELVINLTIPTVHAEVSLAVLEAGKHVYSEKPLATSFKDGKAMLAKAEAKGLRVGCAPDTFLGGGLQSSRKLLDEGWIGQPVTAVAFFANHGPEAWHPNPDFFYEAGAGPLFDIGPYNLTAYVNFFGPIKEVLASSSIGTAYRTITSEARYGQKIKVEVPSHINSILKFHSGLQATLMTSFDVWSHHLPYMEIYGTDGSLSSPDPNTFAGPLKLRRADAKEWQDVPLSHHYTSESRGIGAADMVTAILKNRPHRASGQLALHVLEAMEAIISSAQEGRWVSLETRPERPQALPLGLLRGYLDD